MSNQLIVEQVAPNPAGRDFVCGDIHGGWSLLESALAAAEFDRDRDRLFCVGDLIDRGAESARFPEYLAQPWFYAILGNHEQMALRSVLDRDPDARRVWASNGGDWIMNIGPQQGRVLVEQLAELPLALELDGFGDEPVVLAHAGVPGASWPRVRDWLVREGTARETREPVHTLLWDRSAVRHVDEAAVAGARHVFHGHTVLDRVVTLGNRTYMDLGSVMTGRFAVIDIERWLASGTDGLVVVEGATG